MGGNNETGVILYWLPFELFEVPSEVVNIVLLVVLAYEFF